MNAPLRRRVIPIRTPDESPEERADRLRKLRKDVTGEEIIPIESESLVTIQRYKSKVRNPLTGIRAHCVECSGGSIKEVNECKVTACALYPFRMGNNPFHAKTQARLNGNNPAEESGDEGEDDVDE